MSGRAVELTIAGMTCRVVTSADESELAMLSAMVEQRLAAILKPGRPVTKQAILLAAIALAHEVSEERSRSKAIADRARGTLSRLLERVDSVLANSDDLALERHGDVLTEDREAPRVRFHEEPRRRTRIPDVTTDRLRDVARVEAVKPRKADKERGHE
ncbi:MAG: cell division protein ZapA [Deltaproteobacteria bacterium]|nr:cell division protein ZapA [Deltaproteobacteria bacterium]